MSSMKERMLRGELYLAADAELTRERARCQALLEMYNQTRDRDHDERARLLDDLLGHLGKGVVIKPTFRCDYGYNISIGADTFVNYDCVMLDVAPIRIGAACQLAPRVQLLTSTHPIDPEPRRRGWESAEPITIGDNVWLGGGAILCPGVTIGEDTVVGAGAVVTRDLPAGVVAAGVPARVLREIGERDRIAVPDVPRA
jgi:maltose O-acetyltransferase